MTRLPVFVGWVEPAELRDVRAALLGPEPRTATIHSHLSVAHVREPLHVLIPVSAAHGVQRLDFNGPALLTGGFGQNFTMPPIPMVLHCPRCHAQHIDAPEPPLWLNPPHKSHLCAACKNVWRPCDLHTNGVAAIRTRGKDDTR